MSSERRRVRYHRAMPVPYVPCPNCNRHVREDESSCPFCKSGFGARAARALGTAAVGAAWALSVAGCDHGPIAAVYGGPPPGPGPRTMTARDAGSPGPKIGPPAPGDEPDDASTASADSGAGALEKVDISKAAIYGGPPTDPSPRIEVAPAPRPAPTFRHAPAYGKPPPAVGD